MNLFDYLKSYGGTPMSELPFGAVDSLCLSLVSYLPLGEHVKQGFSEHYRLQELCGLYLIYQQECEARYIGTMARGNTEFFRLMGKSARFRDLSVTGICEEYCEDEQKQFAALTVSAEDFHFLSFRGTDGSLVGWKEDFNMAFLSCVPSQQAAVRYLEEASRSLTYGTLMLGGHSKGGNLAVFAAANATAPTRDRIEAVYAHDSPGFLPEILKMQGYQETASRRHAFVPQTSIIGLLLDSGDEERVIRSKQHGLLQHDPYTWQVDGTDFVYENEVSRAGRYIDRTLGEWLLKMDVEAREAFVESVYELLLVCEAQSVNELPAAILRSLPKIRERHQDMDEESRVLLREALELLLVAARENYQQDVNARRENSKLLGKVRTASAPVRDALNPIRDALASLFPPKK